jgi:hypothetical protein
MGAGRCCIPCLVRELADGVLSSAAVLRVGLGPTAVRPRRRYVSTVKVRVRVSQGPVVEGNCVAAKRGGEQLETNWRSAAKANSIRRCVTASLQSEGEARNSPGTLGMACKAIPGLHDVVGGGTLGVRSEISGETCQAR